MESKVLRDCWLSKATKVEIHLGQLLDLAQHLLAGRPICFASSLQRINESQKSQKVKIAQQKA